MSMKTGVLIRLRQTFALLLVILSLFSTIRFFIEATNEVNKNNVAVAKWEERFIYARQLLPVHRGIIGYISEWDVPGAGYDNLDQEVEFLLTQYTLAPFVLVKGIKAEWNIAVLRPRSFRTWSKLNSEENYQIIPAGNGVYLIHKSGDQ